MQHYRDGVMPWFLDQIVLDALARLRQRDGTPVPFAAFADHPAIKDDQGNITVGGFDIIRNLGFAKARADFAEWTAVLLERLAEKPLAAHDPVKLDRIWSAWLSIVGA
jgi:hypothetical protein